MCLMHNLLVAPCAHMECIGWLTHQPPRLSMVPCGWIATPKTGNTPHWMDCDGTSQSLPSRRRVLTRYGSLRSLSRRPSLRHTDLSFACWSLEKPSRPTLPQTPHSPSLASLPQHPRIPPPGGPNSPPRGVIHYIGVARFPPGEAGGEKKRGDPQSMISKLSRLHGRVARCSLLAVSKKEPGSYGENFISGKHMEGFSLPWKTIRGGPRITPTTVSMQWIPPPPSRLGWVGNPGISPRAGRAKERVERCCQRLDVLPRRRGKTRTAVIIIKTRQRWCKTTPSSRKTW